MKFSPIKASEEIAKKYKRYLTTIFEIADKDYANQLNQELSRKNVLYKGPYLDVTDSFESGRTICDLIENGILPKSFSRFGFPLSRPLYTHQEMALMKCLAGKNIVVSTGTGSGKTESFLYPILCELAKEKESGTLNPGVRALLIYPMNALANDQVERLRDILDDYPEITYGSYTGQTRHKSSDALREYKILNNGRLPKENELISRDQMINTPPNILITNYAMLEYLMVRPKENTFFHGSFAGNWKYIVMDEAHVYNGSTGIEVSMLLRRLKSNLHNKDIRYILTSATLGNEEQNEEVALFASKLCNSPFESSNVIRAIRIEPQRLSEGVGCRNIEIYKTLAEAILEEDELRIEEELRKISVDCSNADLPRSVYEIIVEDKNYWNIRRFLKEKPQTVYDIAALLQCSTNQVEDFITVASYAEKDGSKLFDARYHMFVKASDSAFITLGRSKKLMLNRNRTIIDSGVEYTVFEMAVCSYCHAIYLIGHTNAQGYFEQYSMHDSMDGKEILYLGSGISDSDEEHELSSEKINVEEYLLCSRCGKIMPMNASVGEKCNHPKADYVRVYRINRNTAELTKCVVCENVNVKGVLRQFFAGQEAVTSVLGTTLFEELPSYKIIRKIKTQEEDTFFDDDGFFAETSVTKEYEDAKQFIAFSDSRQAAAFYASYLQKTYTEILYKRLIIETLKQRNFCGNIVQFAGNLQAEFEKYYLPVDEGLSSEKEAWKTLLSEMVDSYSVKALQNLGFYKLTVDVSTIPGLKALGFTPEENADIINVFLQSMMQDAAISYPVPMNKSDKEYFTYNGHEGAFTYSDSNSNLYRKAFIPSKKGKTNKRAEYMQKVLRRIHQDDENNRFLEKILKSFWNLMIKREILVAEADHYKVNAKKIQLNCNVKFYQCPVCKKITPYNVKGVCPTYNCQGTLKEADPKELFKNNHYYHIYQELEIRPLRIVEHTAQLSRETAYSYQNQFKEKKIDILSCSTTFEMGVDVGTLETVFMRNMPPSPANYAQRAGRAGRSAKSAAYALTFCNKGSHDFMYFNHPEAMIRGDIRPPVFKVENEKIGIRHVFATAFAFFWRIYPNYFSDTETFIERKEDVSGVERLKEYLNQKPENLKQFLFEFLPKGLSEKYDVNNFGWVDKLIDEQGKLTWAIKDYTYEVGILEKAYEEALSRKGKVDYLRTRINTYKKENILSFLSRKNVFPKYGFPVDNVELSVREIDSGSSAKIELQRDLAMAISEYAPGSQVVADGNLITSQYIRKAPDMDWKQFDYIYCECSTLNIEPHVDCLDDSHLKICSVCGKPLDQEKIGTFIVPEFGFGAGTIEKAGLIKPRRTYNSEVAYIGYHNQVQKNKQRSGDREYEIAFSQNDEMAVLNRSNFFVCNRCGFTRLSNKSFQSVLLEQHRRAGGGWCENNKLQKYSLGYRFETDVIQIRFIYPQINEFNQALSILYGIMKGTCSYLSIEEKDLAGCLQYFYNQATRRGSFTIVLYDRTPGGAGHVKRLNNADTFENVLKETYRIVNSCTCGGTKMDTSCYNCLRSYSNQKYHDLLQRRYVVAFLEEFFKAGGN